MSEKSVFAVGKTYNFNVYPDVLLGNDFNNVTVMGVVNASIAQNFIDLEALHTQVYSYLPQGTPNNPRSYDYVLLKTLSGNTTVVGITWIDLNSVVEVTTASIQVVISSVNSEDISRISDALVANGYSKFTINML